MKQVVIRGGTPLVVEVPAPAPAPGWVLVANAASVISSGTERAAVASGAGSAPVRAIRNPELIRRAVDYAREHGLRETLDLARGATAPDLPLGYSSAGKVLDTGGVPDLRPGALVACAGAGHANHAEVVSVPANLIAAVPDGVSPSGAAFATLGAIALQGVRRCEPTLGERVVVVGLGLIGLLTVQLLVANGCLVYGVEPREDRRALAERLGAERAVSPGEAATAMDEWSGRRGVDAAIVTASAAGDDLLNNSIGYLRPKGRVVIVGDVGLGLERAPVYRREADVRISTSYGPGRYDPTYEEGGLDYPFGYVRWTEQRNMEAFLQLVAAGRVSTGELVELERPLDQAPEAYAAVNGPEPPLAAVLTYALTVEPAREVVRVAAPGRRPSQGPLRVAIVGAGDFVRGVHLPNLKRDGRATVDLVVTRHGTSADDAARLAGGARAATDWRLALEDPDVELVLVGTRHDSHAEIAAAALRAGKAVFVEKPLGLTRAEIDDVWQAAQEQPRLAIGFNRPFAPLARRLEREVRETGGPIQLVYRVCSRLAPEHWLNDPDQGGGRLVGEACHMFDFANWLAGTPARVFAAALPAPSALPSVESATVTIEYEGGSVATVHYSGAGAQSMPKERVEVMGGGRSWVLDDFGRLESYAGATREEASSKPDKGHGALMARVIDACRGEAGFEPGIEAAYAAQSVALAALESLATGEAVTVELPAASPNRAESSVSA